VSGEHLRGRQQGAGGAGDATDSGEKPETGTIDGEGAVQDLSGCERAEVEWPRDRGRWSGLRKWR